jgi:hypothetical protein
MRERAPMTVVIPAKAGIQYAAASRFITGVSGILDHPRSRVMTVGNSLKPSLRAKAKQSMEQQQRKNGLLRRFAPRNDDEI